MVQTAGGGRLTRTQAKNMWDQTILPFGRKRGLLTGYVKPQEGSSKRTTAGQEKLQRQWHACVDDMLSKIRQHAMGVLGGDEALVDKIMPWLVVNLDEECLQARGKNSKIVGSKDKKKHDNQNGSSRLDIFFWGHHYMPVLASS